MHANGMRQLRICLSPFEKKKQSRQKRRRVKREAKRQGGNRLRERERKNPSIPCPAAMENDKKILRARLPGSTGID